MKTDKIKDVIKKNPWIPINLYFIVSSIISVLSIQFLILEWEDFTRTSISKLLVNAICCLVIYEIMYLAVAMPRVSAIVSYLLVLAIGFADFFVYQFRGNEMTFADVRAVKTGLSVASGYNFSFNYRCVIVLLLAVAYIVVSLVWVKLPKGSKIVERTVAALCAVLAIVIVCFNAVGTSAETWEQKGSYHNGYIYNFILEVRDSFVTKPDGYSAKAVKGLESKYQSKDSSRAKSQVKDPTIIVVMNESFADLSVIGDLQTNVPVTPFINSLKENTTRGYALSSVYGAKTPNSEWEFLSGNSMAFIPKGAVVYQQYISKSPYTLVNSLKEEGYSCVAMHPYYDTGWSRNKVYPNMGFDEMHFIEDFDQNNVLREYITDAELYDKIISRFEKKQTDEKLFIMSVTMQNHGGYVEDYANFSEQVYKLGTSYSDANQYLSLLNESDKAMEDFISYFKDVEEPVEIVFFGDHQPGLYSKFYELLNGKGVSGLTLSELENLYTVPFFIWTNYESEEENIEMTSLNYLSTLALEKANIDLPEYNQYLADLMEEIPAINASGYFSKKENKYLHLDEATKEEASWLKTYEILQYNSMFDRKNRSSKFFPDSGNK